MVSLHHWMVPYENNWMITKLWTIRILYFYWVPLALVTDYPLNDSHPYFVYMATGWNQDLATKGQIKKKASIESFVRNYSFPCWARDWKNGWDNKYPSIWSGAVTQINLCFSLCSYLLFRYTKKDSTEATMKYLLGVLSVNNYSWSRKELQFSKEPLTPRITTANPPFTQWIALIPFQSTKWV